MNEKLLQFIWHHQYYNSWDLRTVSGEPLLINNPGIWNRDQGPDFLGGRIKVNGEVWAGNIELHVRTSDWDLHGHSRDPNYKNVVLHVVWEHDEALHLPMPVLELRSRVPAHLHEKYRKWMRYDKMIPCASELGGAEPRVIESWLKLLLQQRLNYRSAKMMGRVKALQMDWEEAFWQCVARAFGYKVNADAFEAISATIPVKLMMRHRNSLVQLEALLLGQAGLLRTDNGDEYAKTLFREYGFLRKKYQLIKAYQPVHFLRMRPGNFPTIRLAQLAALLARHGELFRTITELDTADEMMEFFRVEAGEYWDTHYRFAEPSVYLKKQTGGQFISNMLINTVIPYLGAYYEHAGNKEKVVLLNGMMENIAPESNSITACFSKFGLASEHAGHTQALLELKKEYCDKIRCLECAIGRSLLRKSPVGKLAL